MQILNKKGTRTHKNHGCNSFYQFWRHICPNLRTWWRSWPLFNGAVGSETGVRIEKVLWCVLCWCLNLERSLKLRYLVCLSFSSHVVHLPTHLVKMPNTRHHEPNRPLQSCCHSPGLNLSDPGSALQVDPNPSDPVFQFDSNWRTPTQGRHSKWKPKTWCPNILRQNKSMLREVKRGARRWRRE